MAKLSQTDKEAENAYEKRGNHSWYLDPTVVPIVLANSDWSLESDELEKIAKKIYNSERPEQYDLLRKNNSGFLPVLDEMSEFESPPSLANFINEESWLIFDILGHKVAHCKWMLLPREVWKLDPDYMKFQTFVKNLAVVNDSSERAVKLVQGNFIVVVNSLSETCS